MPTLTCVAGLPGSGKSCWIAQNLETPKTPELKTSGPNSSDLSNFSLSNSIPSSITNTDLFVVHDFKKETLDGTAQFSSSRRFGDLIEALNSGMNAAIDDIGFCHPEARAWVERDVRGALDGSIEIRIDWVFFEYGEYAVQKCARNIQQRALREADRDVAKELAYLSKWGPRYVVPEGARVIEVWAGG